MSTKSLLRRKRPVQLQGKSIKDANEEGKNSLHKIDRRKVTVQASVAGAKMGDLGGTFVPSDEQLAKINQFTPKTVTADDVVAFTANAMNDLYDRDDEKFTKPTVQEFASLPQPFSPIGKTYLVDHDHTVAAKRGRIFDVSTKTIGGAHFLRPDIYTPKTEQYANFIEDLDFGMNSFVSVGVVVDKADCSICGAPVRTVFRWSWCESGHEKGFYYVPGKEEDDGWGYFLPVDPSTRGAVKARVDLKDAVDFYELSQVYLGSQLFAQLADKMPSFKSVMKTAAKRSIPIVGLSDKEAKKIAMPHEPKEVAEARSKFSVTEDDDGALVWTDAAGLKWTWNPEESEKVLCLGATDEEDDLEADDDDAEDKDADDEDTDDSEEDEDTSEEDDEDEDSTDDSASSDDDADDKDADGEIEKAGHTHSHTHDSGATTHSHDHTHANGNYNHTAADAEVAHAHSHTSNTTTQSADDKEAPPASAVLKAAVKAKLPQAIIDALADADDEKALEIAFSKASKLIKSGDRKIKDLEPKAALGDQWVQEAEKNALHWFTVSRRDPRNPTKGVNVEHAQKLIKLAGGDIETLKSLANEWKQEAEKKFPSAPKRSAFAEDVETGPDGLGEVSMDKEAAEKVRKLHG
jgi:hypothetical protein